jgi:hypothetical protein
MEAERIDAVGDRGDVLAECPHRAGGRPDDPSRSLRRVDFPEPFAPSRATRSPRSIRRSMPSSATWRPLYRYGA